MFPDSLVQHAVDLVFLGLFLLIGSLVTFGFGESVATAFASGNTENIFL